jgi:hypothetical protein
MAFPRVEFLPAIDRARPLCRRSSSFVPAGGESSPIGAALNRASRYASLSMTRPRAPSFLSEQTSGVVFDRPTTA